MKKILILLLILAPLIPFIWKQYAYAQEKEPEITIVNKDQTFDRDYFAANETVRFSGTVNGDAYVFGGKVYFDGVINGDLIVAGGEVEIRGVVENDLRVAGGDVDISGQINGNTSVAGGDVGISNQASISGSLNAASGNIEVEGEVGKDANIASGNVYLNGIVTRDFSYWGENKATLGSEASVGGRTNEHIGQIGDEKTKAAVLGFFAAIGILLKLATLITTLIIGYLLIRYTPIFTNNSIDLINKKTLNTFIIGLISIVLIPIISVFLFFTLIGIPFAFIFLFGLFVLWLVAKAIISIFIGRKIFAYFKKKQEGFLALLVGLIVYLVVTSLPLVGWLIGLVLVSIGVGAILIQKKEYYKNLRAKKLI